jgi:hypothetical protein
VAQWARQLGHDVALDVWRARGASWRDGVLIFALSSLEKSPRRVRFSELLLSPFITGHTIRSKALAVSAMLALLWLLPRRPALAMARRLLQLPDAGESVQRSR